MQPTTSNRPALHSRLGRESFEGVPARGELLKQSRDRWSILVRYNDSPPVRPLRVAIACRRIARIQAALGLLEHSLQRFLSQVLGVVPRHQDLDAVNELL